ncbi:hypothetical protein ACFOET_03350 [Parapedobacter deserti]|uniref:Uncharacterized protein n=1 Tax=Parapedobacter deserti TaxID=1912957 RepID=A0ABV7JEV3_9SPHI
MIMTLPTVAMRFQPVSRFIMGVRSIYHRYSNYYHDRNQSSNTHEQVGDMFFTTH